ncbi:hypothetical protein CBW65_18040 [Tumebacillus avium]|uniref:Carrier domain-containing protein n=1 Tax=Tumebacillus avium TaxID=1903704 RepID=A0A1Y0IPX7_9BACL|nr:non-ribosomal peptide synthetase [Tumebacillus avium]ARU62662.1 hypothetical protein CBW65_18040 [Tumebacillus avium]
MDKRANLTPAQRALLEKRIKGKGPVMPASTLQKKTGIPRRPEGESPLSYSQERIWIMELLEPEAAAYNVPFVVSITGKLDYSLLSTSINEVVRRHEALRTSFQVTDGTPTLLIHDQLTVSIQTLDIRHLPLAERDEAAERLSREDARRPFDLTQGPLVRVTTIQKADEEHLLLITMHHIISDGWSLGVLINEFSILYASYKNGLPSPLPELQVQYSDFAYWQKLPEQQAALQQHLDYWTEQLGGELEPLHLPTDRPRPISQTFNGATTRFMLSRSLSDALQTLSMETGTTLFMTLLSAYQTFLARYTGQTDILVGSPIANRNRHEIEDLVGVFINTLVLRSRVESGMTFRGLLENVRRTTLDAFAHQDLPFEKLVEVLQSDRNMAYSPLFQAMFILQNNTQRTLSMPGLTLQIETMDTKTALFDITLSFFETEQGLEGHWEYNTDLFDQETVERMILHFQTLLSGIVDNPDQFLHQLPILPHDEQIKMLRDWNETAVPSREACIHHFFEEQVERTPDAIALVFENQALTYRELNNRANRIAGLLQAQGVGPDDVIGIFMERSPEMLIALLATHKAGGGYLPLDPSYPQERLSFMIGDAKPKVVVTQPSLAGQLPPHDAHVLTVTGEEPSGFLPNPESPVQPEHLAYIIYTSGSTGLPKGVMVEHRNAAHLFTGMDEAIGCGEQDAILGLTSIGFDISVIELFWSLTRGAKIILLSEHEISEAALSVSEYSLRQQLQRHNATFLQCTPSLMGMIVAAPGGLAALAPLKKILLGGEALPPALAKQLKQHSGVRLFNGYGPTETTVYAAHYEVTDTDMTSIPLGRPIANYAHYILDAHLQPVPIGVPGELHIGGPGVTRGYLGREELTAERFIPNPYGEGRLYKTGDLTCYLPDGTVKFLGRIDHQVKVRGYRVELGEIEARLAEHDAIREGVVIARDNTLIAYLVAEGEHLPDPLQLRGFLSARLPEFMVPTVYLQLDVMPLTPSGKIDRKALPAPEVESSLTVKAEYVAPSTPLEIEVCAIWTEVLQVEQVGVQDNFFTLGGHSLLATRLISRVNSRFGTQLPLRCLFEAPTILQLAALIEGQERTVTAPPILPASRDEHLPLSFAQERLWFLDQLLADTATYNIPIAVRMQGTLNGDALLTSIQSMVQRHESLRTTFRIVDGQPRQIFTDDVQVSLPVADVRDDNEARQLALEEARQPFDLAQGPLLRAKLLRLGEHDHVLLLTLHHIIADEWSMGLIVQEISETYGALAAGQTPLLQALPIQYADYAAWQREWLQGEVLQKQLDYWKNQLGGELPVLNMPTDHPRPAVQTEHGASQTFLMDAELTAKLHRLSQQKGGTLFMTLLAAFNTLLYRYTGQDDIVIGSPIAGRGREEIEGLIGFFVNTLVLRTDLSGQPTFAELVERVKETALQAYEHQDVPFEKLVEVLQPERDMSRSPLFQAMFVLQNAVHTHVELPGVTLSGFEVDSQTAKFDLNLFLQENPNGELSGRLEYSTDLFEGTTITRLIEHFVTLLEAAAEQPEQRIADLPWLGAEERQQLLIDWNNTQEDLPLARIDELVTMQAERTPDAAAVTFNGQLLTYRELNLRANQVAHRLQKLGAGPDVPVGLSMERSLEMIIGLLGIIKSGSAYVPLDPAYPKDRLGFILEETRIPILLTQQGVMAAEVQDSVQVIELDTDRSLLEESGENPVSQARLDDLVYILYTSGSTGRPKGVAMPHRPVANLLAWQKGESRKADARTLQFTSLNFDVSFQEIFATLSAGGTLVLIEEALRHNLLELPHVLIAEKVERLFLPFIALQQLAEICAELKLYPRDLQEVITAGEQLQITKAIRSLFAELPDCTLSNQYGPTESHVVTAHTLQNGEAESWPLLPSIGRPIANAKIYVLDAAIQPVPVGVQGELYLGGPVLARGYLGRDDLTAERFLPNPFAVGEPLYKTGDGVRWLADGTIQYLGRLDNQVKIRGFRIELGEIEAVLTQHPEIQECVVVAREDVPGDKRLVAYLVAGRDQTPDLGEVRAYLKAHLPAYMVPAFCMQLDQIPLSPNGKVDRRQLPAPEAGERLTEYVAPRTPTEERLVAIWSDLLRVKEISVHDNFFDIGGHSLLATQLVTRIQSEFKVALHLRDLFEKTTIAELAQEIEAAETVQAPVYKRLERVGTKKKR